MFKMLFRVMGGQACRRPSSLSEDSSGFRRKFEGQISKCWFIQYLLVSAWWVRQKGGRTRPRLDQNRQQIFRYHLVNCCLLFIALILPDENTVVKHASCHTQTCRWQLRCQSWRGVNNNMVWHLHVALCFLPQQLAIYIFQNGDQVKCQW